MTLLAYMIQLIYLLRLTVPLNAIIYSWLFQSEAFERFKAIMVWLIYNFTFIIITIANGTEDITVIFGDENVNLIEHEKQINIALIKLIHEQ